MSHEPSHLDLQYLPSSLLFLNIKQVILKSFRNFADVILLSAFFALYRLVKCLNKERQMSTQNLCFMENLQK